MPRTTLPIRTIPLLVLSVALLSQGLLSEASATGAAEPRWTIMVYMAADSEPGLPWEDDVNEMEASGLADWMDVLVLIDPLGDSDSMLLKVSPDDDLDDDIVSQVLDDQGEVIPSGGEVDMTSPETLSDFIDYSWRNYPADRVALVLWGHSAGWHGLCADGLDLMRLPELGAALGTAVTEMERVVDLVIADSCTEGVLETIFELRGLADYYVGSEIAVPAQGLPYDQVLGALAEDREMSPEEWGAEICELHRMNLLLNSWSATMAVYDLAALDPFVDDLDDLSEYIVGYAGLYRDDLEELLLSSASSDLTEWYVDAGDMLERLVEEDLPFELRQLALGSLGAYQDLVRSFSSYPSPYDDNYADVANSTGVVIYCPGDGPSDAAYWTTSFSDTGWGGAASAVRADEPEMANGPAPAVTYDDSDGDGADDTALLHWDSPGERSTAWVAARSEAGLQLLTVLHSTDGDLAISGVAGELWVSASSWENGMITSHHELDITLTGTVDVTVTVMTPDGPVTDGMGVVLITRNGPLELSADGVAFAGNITIPGDATYGDLLTVEVRDRAGAVLAMNSTYVRGGGIVMEVLVFNGGGTGPGVEFVVPMAALAAAAILMFMLARSRKRGLH